MQKRIIFYEVNPLYFRDTNDDGIGDLQGMLKQVSYFDFLGVDAIILPNILSKYSRHVSISNDYKQISEEIGTLDDFRELTKQLKNKGIKTIIDINIGSITESHQWFKQAEMSKEDFKKIIATPEIPDDVETKDIPSDAIKSEKTQSYYYVDEKTSQIALNWKGDTIRNMFLDVARFWHELGVEGFRFSNFEYLSQPKPLYCLDKDTTLVELRRFYRALKEINENFIIVGKSKEITPKEAATLLNPTTRVIDYFQTTTHSYLGTDDKYGCDLIGEFSQKDLIKSISKYIIEEKNRYNTILALDSNEVGRAISRWGGDGQFNVDVAKAIMMLQLTWSGSPLIYYGSEIGAKNIGLTYLDDFQDATLYERKRRLEAEGISTDEFMAAQVSQNPINAHSLMAWTDKKNGGFSNSEKTIVPVSSSYREINVMNQYSETNSVLGFYKKLIKFTKSHEISEILLEGQCTIKAQKLGTGVIQIVNNYLGKSVVSLINFTDKPKRMNVPLDSRVVVGTHPTKNYRQPSNLLFLNEYEAILFVSNSVVTDFDKEEMPIIHVKPSKLSDNEVKKHKIIEHEEHIMDNRTHNTAKVFNQDIEYELPTKTDTISAHQTKTFEKPIHRTKTHEHLDNKTKEHENNLQATPEEKTKLMGQWRLPKDQTRVIPRPAMYRSVGEEMPVVKKDDDFSSHPTQENLIKKDSYSTDDLELKNKLQNTMEMVQIKTEIEEVKKEIEELHREVHEDLEKTQERVIMQGTLEMIARDIQGTQELNVDDDILSTQTMDLSQQNVEARDKTYEIPSDQATEETHATRVASHDINSHVNKEMSQEMELLEEERLQSHDLHTNHATTLESSYEFDSETQEENIDFEK